MKYPCLVREKNCKTDIKVNLYSEDISEDGEPISVQLSNLKCNYQDKAKRVLSPEKVIIQLTGCCYFPGDIAPDLPVISGGEVVVFGEKRKIYQGTKARNPDGSVNYTLLELM